MEDITLFLMVGGIVTLVVQYYVHAVPMYLIGELLGIGGLIAVIGEVNANTMDTDIGMLLTIAMVVVILYSAMNFVGHYWPVKGWKS